jgi:hypothetical protein
VGKRWPNGREQDTALDSTPDIETRLADLSEVSLQQLRSQVRGSFEPFLKILLSQVERPRFNLGSGPPGRAD